MSGFSGIGLGTTKIVLTIPEDILTLRQSLYIVQIVLIPVLIILPFQIEERVASDIVIFNSNPFVILLSFAKHE